MGPDRIYHNCDEAPAPSHSGGAPGNTRNYRQESADTDAHLTESVSKLAVLYSPADLVNCGAQ